MAFLDSHDNLVGVFDSRIGSLDVTDVGSSIAKAFVKQQTLSIQPGDLVREIRGGAQ
jgi:transcription elongation factor